MPLGKEVGLGPDHIVLDGDRPTEPLHQKGAHSPNFRPMSVVASGQTTGWIKMPLDAKVCLGPGHTVLHGQPAHPRVIN